MTPRHANRFALIIATVIPQFVAAQPVAPLIAVTGGTIPVALSAAEFAALPRAKVGWTVHGKTMNCEGPWLADLVARAGLPTGDAVHGAALSTLIVATARDGYRVTFTLGELDHKLGNAPVIVADRCDGAALPAKDGPLRLVAATDQRGARSVRQLEGLHIVAPPAVDAAPPAPHG